MKPGGPIRGVLSKFVGATRQNPFWEAFKGSTIEYGAQIARIAMPGTRAARIINVFRETAPSDWSTIESGINNTAATLRGAISKDMAVHSEEYADLLGSGFGKLNTTEKYRKKQAVLDKLEKDYENVLYEQIYDAEPELLSDKVRKKIEAFKELRKRGKLR